MIVVNLKNLMGCFFRHSSSSIFEKIQCNLWWPAFILSIGKYRCYACFVNDFSKYIWIIPLQHKSDFVNTNLAFKQYVTRQFNKHIKVFYYGGGWEFINSKLSSHFLLIGIHHQESCSYTPEQTSRVQRHHRLIQELDMTMLFHNSSPLFL